MGFSSLLSASKIGAVYDTSKQELILSAEVLLNNVTYGIVFRPQPWLGEYKFALEGWILNPQKPVTDSITRIVRVPYDPRFLKSIVVVSQEFPNGEVIPVHFVGVFEEVTEKRTAAPPSAVVENPPQTVLLNEVLDQPFTIKASVTTFIWLDKWDERYVKLVGANLIEGNIEWTFEPITPGTTAIRVTSERELGGPVFHVDYAVTIRVPNELTDGVSEVVSGANETLHFVGRLQEVVTHVQKTYPDAVLHSATDSTHDLKYGVNTIGALFDLIAIFRLPGEEKWISQELIGDYFLKPHEVREIIGVPDVKWPVEFQAEDALDILRRRGVKEDFWRVELTSTVEHGDPPFSPTWLYVFYLIDGTQESVQLLQSATKEVVQGTA